MAIRHHALVGVNAGYSYSNYPWNLYHGDPSQFFVLDGKILSELRTPGRSSLGILTKDGKETLIVDTPLLEIEDVFDNTRKFDITGINRKKQIQGPIPGAVNKGELNNSSLATKGSKQLVVAPVDKGDPGFHEKIVSSLPFE